LARGKRVRAIVRDARKAEPLRAAGAELQVVDGHDVPRVAQALRDVEGAYVMLPPRVDSEDLLLALAAYTDAMARALREVRVPHVVLLSSIGSQLPAGTGPIASTHYAEQALRAESSALSILRPPYFMDNWAGSLTRLAENKLASMFALDLAIPMIASEDIGRIAAALLVEGGRGRQVVELEGPRNYSPRDVAHALSAIVGREITPELLPNAAIVSVLTAAGISPRNAELLREMYAGIDSGLVKQEGNARTIRGNVSIDQVLRRLLPAV
jgi:uncharacterized protein YbjT (DUF2867 family)